MALDLKNDLETLVDGQVVADDKTREFYSHDTSLFELVPDVVVYPKNVADLSKLIKYVWERKDQNPNLSLTARSGGSDMSGGAINTSIILDMTKHFNKIGKIDADGTYVEPGAFYRDFEVKTLAKKLLLPTYPASKNLCALGGMIANNSGGERSLHLGQTIDYVTELKVVLVDGKEHTFGPIGVKELKKKMAQSDFEGEVYRKVFELAESKYKLIKNAKPKVSKNSTGYNIWSVWDRETGIFDLSKLFVGSQGTLGIITGAKVKLVDAKPCSGLMAVYLNDINLLPGIIQKVLSTNPETFETFDNQTMKLALKFIPNFLLTLGFVEWMMMGLQFSPQLFFFATSGIPKLTLLVEYEAETQEEVGQKIDQLQALLKNEKVVTVPAKTPKKAERYKLIRRESFNLLRKNLGKVHTAPFIDDFIVPPETLVEFFPKLKAILEKYKLNYTIAGHMGNGNFHVIPLMDLSIESERQKIPLVSKLVYELVLKYGGSISAEHNEGLIRGPYTKQMYGEKVYKVFEEIKQIFDSKNIFNNHKKTDASMEFSLAHIREKF